MRTTLFLAACVGLAVAIAGCGESAEKRAADEIARQVDLSRRHYLRAAGLMSEPLLPDETTGMTPVSKAEVLGALNQAEQGLTKAVAAAGDATRIGKAPAQSLLAEIRLAKARYHAHAVRGRLRRSRARINAAESKLEAIVGLVGLGELNEKLGAMDDSDLIGRRDRIRAERSALLAETERLSRDRQALTGQIETLTGKYDAERALAAQRRAASEEAEGAKVLELLTEAEKVEGRINEIGGQIGDLRLSVEDLDHKLKRTEMALSGMQPELASIDERVDRTKLRAKENNDRGRRLLAEAGAKSKDLAEEVDGAAKEFAEAVEHCLEAIAACEQAAKANQSALLGVEEARRLARQVVAEDGKSGVKPILDWMGRKGRKLAPKAQQAHIALTLADLQAELLEAADPVRAFAEKIKATRQVQGAEAISQAFDEALKRVADGPKRVAVAREEYDKASMAFKQAQGLDAAATKWIYQGGEAQAQFGLYRLSVYQNEPDEAFRNSARSLIDDVLKEYPDKPDFLGPIYQLDQAVRQAG